MTRRNMHLRGDLSNRDRAIQVIVDVPHRDAGKTLARREQGCSNKFLPYSIPPVPECRIAVSSAVASAVTDRIEASEFSAIARNDKFQDGVNV